MKFLERISSKGKLNALTLLALTGGVVMTGATVFCGISLVETKSAIDFNKYNSVMATKFQEDYTKVKSDLTKLLNDEVDSVSISTIYYLFSQSKKEYVITSVITSDTASTVMTVDNVAVTPQGTTVPAPVTPDATAPVTPAAPDATAPVTPNATAPVTPDATAPTVPTDGQTNTVVQSPPNSGDTQAVTPEATVPLPQRNKTGNSPVVISFRGDVKGVLSYLDKTKLNYTLVSYFSHNGVNSCTLEVRR